MTEKKINQEKAGFIFHNYTGSQVSVSLFDPNIDNDDPESQKAIKTYSKSKSFTLN
jgi:hypothetical protein